MNILEAENIKVLRGEILKAIYENHRLRLKRLRLPVLEAHLEKLYLNPGTEELVTVLEDMKERGYLTFDRDEDRWRRRREVKPVNIQITPAGRDLVESTKQDPAVQFE